MNAPTAVVTGAGALAAGAPALESAFTEEGISIEPEIITRPATQIVGVEFNPEKHGWALVPTLWFALCRHIGAIRNVVHADVSYGFISGKEPMRVDSYLAGVEVSVVDALPEGTVTRMIPAGTYAVFTVRGGLGKVGPAYGYINQQWMPKSKYRDARCGALERYDARFAPNDACQFEIWVAVEPKGQ